MVVYERYSGCHYDVHWPNRAGCPSLPLIQRLRSASSVGNMSAGGTFMMVLFFALAIYLVGGCFYKRQNEGATGIEACPHHTFWCALPAIAMGALSTLTGKISDRPSTRGFERCSLTISLNFESYLLHRFPRLIRLLFTGCPLRIQEALPIMAVSRAGTTCSELSL